MSLTALEALKNELHNLYRKELDCVYSSGIVKFYRRDDYQRYVREEKRIKDSIEILEQLNSKIKHTKAV